MSFATKISNLDKVLNNELIPLLSLLSVDSYLLNNEESWWLHILWRNKPVYVTTYSGTLFIKTNIGRYPKPVLFSPHPFQYYSHIFPIFSSLEDMKLNLIMHFCFPRASYNPVYLIFLHFIILIHRKEMRSKIIILLFIQVILSLLLFRHEHSFQLFILTHHQSIFVLNQKLSFTFILWHICSKQELSSQRNGCIAV
jgi:hypothetical protein